MQLEHKELESKNHELQDRYREKARNQAQLNKLYQTLKQQQIASGMEAAVDHDAEHVLHSVATGQRGPSQYQHSRVRSNGSGSGSGTRRSNNGAAVNNSFTTPPTWASHGGVGPHSLRSARESCHRPVSPAWSPGLTRAHHRRSRRGGSDCPATPPRPPPRALTDAGFRLSIRPSSRTAPSTQFSRRCTPRREPPCYPFPSGPRRPRLQHLCPRSVRHERRRLARRCQDGTPVDHDTRGAPQYRSRSVWLGLGLSLVREERVESNDEAVEPLRDGKSASAPFRATNRMKRRRCRGSEHGSWMAAWGYRGQFRLVCSFIKSFSGHGRST